MTTILTVGVKRGTQGGLLFVAVMFGPMEKASQSWGTVSAKVLWQKRIGKMLFFSLFCRAAF